MSSMQFPVKQGDMLNVTYIGREGISLIEMGAIPIKQVEDAFAGIDHQQHYRTTTYVLPDGSLKSIDVLYLERDAFW